MTARAARLGGALGGVRAGGWGGRSRARRAERAESGACQPSPADGRTDGAAQAQAPKPLSRRAGGATASKSARGGEAGRAEGGGGRGSGATPGSSGGGRARLAPAGGGGGGSAERSPGWAPAASAPSGQAALWRPALPPAAPSSWARLAGAAASERGLFPAGGGSSGRRTCAAPLPGCGGADSWRGWARPRRPSGACGRRVPEGEDGRTRLGWPEGAGPSSRWAGPGWKGPPLRLRLLPLPGPGRLAGWAGCSRALRAGRRRPQGGSPAVWDDAAWAFQGVSGRAGRAFLPSRGALCTGAGALLRGPRLLGAAGGPTGAPTTPSPLVRGRGGAARTFRRVPKAARSVEASDRRRKLTGVFGAACLPLCPLPLRGSPPWFMGEQLFEWDPHRIESWKLEAFFLLWKPSSPGSGEGLASTCAKCAVGAGVGALHLLPLLGFVFGPLDTMGAVSLGGGGGGWAPPWVHWFPDPLRPGRLWGGALWLGRVSLSNN